MPSCSHRFVGRNHARIRFKIKAKGRQTKGYLLQTYYRCQHNTRNCSLSKDPQRKLSLNPTARVKNTNCPFQMVLKINHCSVYTTDIDWDHNHLRDHLEASNFKKLSADCFQKSHSMLKAGSSNLYLKMK